MDDYSIQSLTESKNEWSARLVSILSFNIIQGINSIYIEALRLCEENDEQNKYLMTFQNLLSKIPDWSTTTIETERKRIETVSGCKYLEDLITCVHIIQLKALTCIRVGLKQKKIDIDIPSIDKFIHKVYINVARKLYSNVYLFEQDIYPLQKQKNNRELELLVKEAILNTIRDNIPVEHILRVYIDETEEQEEVEDEEIVKKEIDKIEKEKQLLEQERNAIQQKEQLELAKKYENEKLDDDKSSDYKSDENINLEVKETYSDKLENLANKIEKENDKLSIDFSDIDPTLNGDGEKEDVVAPKDLDTLEKKAQEIKQNEIKEEGDDVLDIGNEIDIDLDSINLEETLSMNDEIKLDDIEEL